MAHRGSAAPCIGQETPGDQKVGLLGQKKHGNLAIKKGRLIASSALGLEMSETY